MKYKIINWLKRFLPAELLGSALAIVVSYSVLYFSHNAVLAAYAAAIADTSGFYATLFVQGMLRLNQQLKSRKQPFQPVHTWQVLQSMLIEFGPAELLDSLLLRPFFMYLFPALLHNRAWGILVGKVVSDVCFYVPVIIIAAVKSRIKRAKGH